MIKKLKDIIFGKRLKDLVIIEVCTWSEGPVNGCGTWSCTYQLLVERESVNTVLADMLEAYLTNPEEQLCAQGPPARTLADFFVRPLVKSDRHPSTWGAYVGGPGIGSSTSLLSDKTSREGIRSRIEWLRKEKF